jgi:glycosyltransferase involved in cell wall biosynthesis
MHILFLDQFSELGGAQRCLLDLLPAIAERGWQAHAAVPGNGPLVKQLSCRGATVDSIHCGPYHSGHKSAGDVARFIRDAPRLVREIRALLDRYEPRLLYVNGPRLMPAAAWAARKRAPLVFHCHNYLAHWYDSWLVRTSIDRARATVIGTCRFVTNRLKPASAGIVYNGVEASPFPPPAIGTAGEWRIGVIGRIAPEKGQAEFLQAAGLLLRDVPNCRFVICGDTATRQHEDLRRLSEGLPVAFLGWRDDVYAVLAELDLLVVPSTVAEATPRVILEAYAAGVPVLASRIGGIPEVISDHETGFLLDSVSPEALAGKIRTVLSDPTELRHIARRATAVYQKKFTLTRYQRQMVEVLRQVMPA